MIKYRHFGHYIAGGIAGGIGVRIPILGLSLVIAFLAYEICQDWRKEDWSYHDILEFVVALFIVAAGMSIWEVLK